MTEELKIRTSDDVVRVRQRTREIAVEAGLNLVEQTKVVTAASELARNTLDYGGGGRVTIDLLTTPRRGVRLCFEDECPGIPDVEAALRDGFTTGTGLGLGLGGARRLSSDFSIETSVGRGTRITIARWKP